MKTRQLRLFIVAGVIVALGIATAVWYTRSDKTGTVAPSAAKGERKVLYWTDPMIPGFKSDKPGKSPMGMDMVPVYEDDAAAVAPSAAKGERKVLYWTDPMTPGFKSDKPGKSPFMDMELVPVYEDEAGATIVSVRPEIVQNLGVRTYTVTRGSQPRRVAVTGYLFRDARGLAALVDLIDRDASFVRVGQRAEVRVADAPDRTWGGTVEKVESDVDIGARTVKARIRLSQTSAVLKPNMFAEVTILGTAVDKQALFVPREALIRTGTRNAVVLALGSGRFQPVAVTPGVESDDWIEIRHGIKEGDVVVTSGQFLIDSEASVRASFSRMQSAEPGAADESKTPAGGAHTGH